MIASVVCIDNNYAIGKDNKLLFNIKEDMKRFKDITTNNGRGGATVICGRKTYESLPKRPLDNRTNIMITSSAPKNPLTENGYTKAKMELIKYWLCSKSVIDGNDGIYIVGGGQIYSELLSFCERVYLTRVDAVIENADTFFPNIEKDTRWELTESEEHITDDGIKYFFEIWDRCDYEIVSKMKAFRKGDYFIDVKTFNNTYSIAVCNDLKIYTDWYYLKDKTNATKFIKKMKGISTL